MSSNDTTREMLDDYIWHFGHGYAISNESKGKTQTTARMHRKLMNVDDSNIFIDHVKRNRFDNRLENLRIATAEENMRNKTKPKNNTSGIMGVYKEKNRWRAQINDNNNKKIQKSFTINNNRTEEQCKQLALYQRNIWREQFGYIGE